jgi:ATP-dependent phosphofructokinase / diphosphate-dependent phosphofructokinase
MPQTIAVLTGGGDCPGLNAAIRAVVKTGIVRHGYRVLGIEEGFDGLVKASKPRSLTLSEVRGILPRGGTMLGTANRGNPFAYPVTVRGKTVVKDMSRVLARRIRALRLRGLVVIGGDGSLNIAAELYRLGLPIVGVPKTIDNDLDATDTTFGFSSAVVTATEAIDRLHTTAESHHRAMVLEVMGRDAGWIALHSGIAGGADVILIPEIPFDIDDIVMKIRERARRGSRFSIIVVAEGARARGARQIIQKSANETLGLDRLGGIGQWVSDTIASAAHVESRVTVLGHLQRGGSPTMADRLLATRFGFHAVELIAKGRFGRMVCVRGRSMDSVPIARAVRRQKLVPPNGELVRVAKGLGISFG